MHLYLSWAPHMLACKGFLFGLDNTETIRNPCYLPILAHSNYSSSSVLIQMGSTWTCWLGLLHARQVRTDEKKCKLTPLWDPVWGREDSAGFQPPVSLDSLHQSHTYRCVPPWPLRHRVSCWSSPLQDSGHCGLQQSGPPWYHPHHSWQNKPGEGIERLRKDI